MNGDAAELGGLAGTKGGGSRAQCLGSTALSAAWMVSLESVWLYGCMVVSLQTIQVGIGQGCEGSALRALPPPAPGCARGCQGGAWLPGYLCLVPGYRLGLPGSAGRPVHPIRLELVASSRGRRHRAGWRTLH